MNSNTNQTSNTQGTQQQGGERQDWLDKGIEFAGKKAGVNIVSALLECGAARADGAAERRERGQGGRLHEQGIQSVRG